MKLKEGKPLGRHDGRLVIKAIDDAGGLYIGVAGPAGDERFLIAGVDPPAHEEFVGGRKDLRATLLESDPQRRYLATGGGAGPGRPLAVERYGGRLDASGLLPGPGLMVEADEKKPAGTGSGNRTDTPDCGTCTHYGANVLASTDTKSAALLKSTHGIERDSCCHPTALIAHGNGAHDTAAGNRGTWCGRPGHHFVEVDLGQLLERTRVEVLEIGERQKMGGGRRCRIRVPAWQPGQEVQVLLGEHEVQEMGGTGTREAWARVNVEAREPSRLRFEDWERE